MHSQQLLVHRISNTRTISDRTLFRCYLTESEPVIVNRDDFTARKKCDVPEDIGFSQKFQTIKCIRQIQL